MNPETKLKTKIAEELRDRGWLVYKINDRYFYGYPDLYCAKGGRSIWIEVKTKTGKLGSKQRFEIKRLRIHGIEAYMVRSVEEALVVMGEV